MVTRTYSDIPPDLRDKIRLWVLRTFNHINNYTIFSRNEYADKEMRISLANLFELEGKIDKEFLQNALSKYEAKKIGNYEILEQNLDMVCKQIGLNKTERAIFEFVIIYRIFELEDFFSEYFVGKISRLNAPYFFAIVLGVSITEAKKALDPKSNLMSSQIFEEHTSFYDISRIFNFLDYNFPRNMFQRHDNIDEIFEFYYLKCKFNDLKFSDYDYLKIDEKNLSEFLQNSKTGTNILIHGAPGTGKTEFVKMLAKSMGKNLYEIPYHDEDYNSQKGDNRFRKIKLADRILKSNNALIMFDEVEDIFNERDISKAMINRTLENNLVPTFWITNDIDCIDSAYIRRFNLVFEFVIPPKSKRLEIIKRYANNQICEKTAKKLAKISQISPALICNASNIIANLSAQNKDEIFTKIIFDNLKAQYGINFAKKKKKKDEIKLPQSYELGYINAGQNLQNLASGIAANQNARICIYGPAGTGKSEFAKFLAKKLDKKLIIKKGSDLLNAYVGATEQNIAAAFKEAKSQKAVLVFDEVDTFLQDRSTAQRSWEISQTNEMLTQMENFDGIFIATTNFIDSLDEACIRRFDMKIKFDFMLSEKAVALFEKECENLGLKPSRWAKNLIRNLSYLTPGDFAAALRTHKFSPFADANDFATRLENEVSHKKIHKTNAKKIGLV